MNYANKKDYVTNIMCSCENMCDVWIFLMIADAKRCAINYVYKN